MINTKEQPKVRITSPEKVARLLDLVGQSGIPLIIRSLNAPTIAVKARAVAHLPGINNAGVKVSNISERGLLHISQCSSGIFQIEFILQSEKVQFFTQILNTGRHGCVFAKPSFLESSERRRNARYLVNESLLPFMSFKNLTADALDLSSAPIFDSAPELGSAVPVCDVSIGGVGLLHRFPSVCRVMEAGRPIESAVLHLPMMSPMPIDISVRWHRRLEDQMVTSEGNIRSIKRFKFGVQFLNLSEAQLHDIQVFIQRLSQADAI